MANEIEKKTLEALILNDELTENVVNIFNNDNKKREMLRKINFDNLEDEAIRLLNAKVKTRPDALSTKDLLDIINVTQTHSTKLNSSINDKDQPIVQVTNNTINVNNEELSEESKNKILLALQIFKQKQEELLNTQEVEVVEETTEEENKENNNNDN